MHNFKNYCDFKTYILYFINFAIISIYMARNCKNSKLSAMIWRMFYSHALCVQVTQWKILETWGADRVRGRGRWGEGKPEAVTGRRLEKGEGEDGAWREESRSDKGGERQGAGREGGKRAEGGESYPLSGLFLTISNFHWGLHVCDINYSFCYIF